MGTRKTSAARRHILLRSRSKNFVLTEEECQQLVNTTSEEEFDQGRTVSGVRFFIKIDIAEGIYKKLRDPSLARDGKLEVSISRVLKSSIPHRDGYYGNYHLGVPEGALVDEEVTILFLNNNHGASFVYGNEKVPVKCGTKVTFNGGHTHNTEVLAGGTVKFLGPLTVSSGLISEDYAGQCECPFTQGVFCSCGACDAGNGLGGTESADSCCCPQEGDAGLEWCKGQSEYDQDPSICGTFTPFPSPLVCFGKNPTPSFSPTCTETSAPSFGPSSTETTGPSSGPSATETTGPSSGPSATATAGPSFGSSATATFSPSAGPSFGPSSTETSAPVPASGKATKNQKSTKAPKSNKAKSTKSF